MTTDQQSTGAASAPEATSEEVHVEADGGVLVVTIDRPRARNAINENVAHAIAAAMQRLDDEPDLQVGVITGAGGTFCAGMDLKAFVRGEHPVVEGRGFAGLVRRPPRKPLIAAVEGYALAGGFEIVLACDLVVAARGATFGIPEVKRSLVAAGGGLLRLPKRIPYHVAMELALLGNHVGAEQMQGYGLVNRLVDDGTALAAATDLGRQLASNGPLSLVASKQIIVESADWTDAQAWDEQERIARPVAKSEDAVEGATAFAEKREPQWRGR